MEEAEVEALLELPLDPRYRQRHSDLQYLNNEELALQLILQLPHSRRLASKDANRDCSAKWHQQRRE